MRTTRLTVLVSALILLVPNMAIAEDSTLTEEERANVSTIKWIFEHGVNAHRPLAWGNVLTDDYVRHCEAMPPELQTIKGKTAMKSFLADIFRAFPDWHEEIQQMVVQGDRIALMTKGTGTMKAKFGPMEPTGKSAVTTTIMIHRFVDGKIAESWVTWDNLHFMNQLGLMPPPGTSAPSDSSRSTD